MGITSDLPKEVLIEALNGDTAKLWGAFRTLDADSKAEKERLQLETEKVKNGITLKFDINEYLFGWYKEYPLHKRVSMTYSGLNFGLLHFKDEIQEREDIMKYAISEAVGDEKYERRG